jgi:soluble lytic murein transglycosylase
MKTFLSLFFVLIFAFQTFSQDFHTKISQLLENRDYQNAIIELNSLKKSDKKLIENNNYDYLLARLAEKKGDFATATSNYQKVIKRKSVLMEYALWHLSQTFRSSGNLVMERVYLQQLNTQFPNSLLKNAVSKRISVSYFESRDYQNAINLLSVPSPNNASPNPTTTSPISRENQVLLAKSFYLSGNSDKAKEIFTNLITTLPNATQPDDYALEAAKGLDEIEVGKENFGKNVSEISDTEHFKRAFIYYFNRDFPDARLHYKAIVEKFPNSTLIAESMYQIGRTYILELNYNEANPWFERVQNQFPETDFARDALSQSAAAFSRITKPKEAVSRYQKFIQQYPEADNLERAYLNIVDIYRDLGEANDALKWTSKAQEDFKGKLPEAIALFTQIRIRIAEKDWNNALLEIDKLLTFPDLGGVRVPSGTNKNEILFLKGTVLEESKRFDEAADVYFSIPDGRSEYYGWRATERLKNLFQNEQTKQFVVNKLASFQASSDAETDKKNAQAIYRVTNEPSLLERIKKDYEKLPNYQKVPKFKLQEFGRKQEVKDKRKDFLNSHQNLADELIFLGLYDEGTPELETALREKLTKNTNSMSDFSPDVAFTLATFFKRGDMANRSIGFLEPLWRLIPADYQIELMPREQAEILYPTPYADSLTKFGPQKQVDPRFLLSIMRQESRFRADVKSNAAARGLMQFISTTSNQLAKELGKTNFKQDELYNPPTAILFGSQYLSNLFKLFPNQPQAVSASYNGGENNMTRWLARSKSDLPDKYVPEILFSQSKDYVYKVLANYRVYQMLYDENLRGIK